MAAAPIPRLTPEEYLAADRAAEFRSEYFDGQMFAMSGGTYTHALLIGGLDTELRLALRKRPCTVTPSEVRLRAVPDGPYFYPDVMVACGTPEFADDQKDTLLNPILIAEVLSPSSEAYDRGFKFSQYRRIPSLQQYLMVSQTEYRIESFRRKPDGTWLFTEAIGVDAVLHCDSLDCTLPLADVYDKVSLTAP